MAAFSQFEEILAWQKARESPRMIYRETINGDASRDSIFVRKFAGQAFQ